MSSFKTALGQFLTGEIEITALESALAEELRARPDAASQINTQLEQLYRSGRLPNQIFAVLKRQVLAGPQAGGGDAATAGEERTRFRVADQQQKSAESERTVFKGPAGATGDTSRSQRSQSSQSRSQSTSGSQPTSGARSGSSHSSNWSNPSEWTGGGAGGADAAPPDVGSIIQGRFVLEQKIGLGGMGIVYKARDLRQEEAQDRNPYVALKLLNEDFKRNPESLKALQREARKAQDLSHQNVVYVSSFDRDGGNVYMVMELLDGEPLDKFIKRHADKGLPFNKVLPIVEGLVAGLGHAHKRGIVHSDFKPSNAWITREGVVKIFDFGIARAAKVRGGDGEKTLFDAGTLGALTPAYASVEMLAGEEPDIRDDVYALGCVTYELLTGAHPFKKRPADEARKQGLKPARIKGLSRRQFNGLCRGLAFDRKDRSQTVENFLEGIRPRQIPKSLIAAAAMAVIVVAVGLGYALPLYLDKLKLDELTQVVKGGDATQITQRLPDIEALDPKRKNELFGDADVKAKFIEYYEKNIAASLNAEQERYDYGEAARLITEAKQVLPDLKDNLRFHDLESSTVKLLDTELNRAIKTGALIPEQGPRNAITIAAAMKVVDPKTDVNLAPTLLKSARDAADADPKLAMTLVDRGLQIAPDDSSFSNLRDQLRTRSEMAARQAQLAQSERNLADALPKIDRSVAFDAVRTQMKDLQDLEPNNATLQTAQAKLKTLLESDVRPLVAAHRYDDAETLVAHFDDTLPADVTASMHKSIAAANQDYQARLTTLVAGVRAAVDDGRLASPAPNNAESALAALIAAGAPDVAVTEARGTIANAYLVRATKARGAAQWDQAREFVKQGLQQQPSDALQLQLNNELAAISSDEQIVRTQGEAERQRRAQEERERDIKSLTASFETTLQKENFTIADANALVDVVKNVQAKGGDVADGRNRIVARIIAQADSFKRAGNYGSAQNFLNLGLALFPGVQALQSSLDQLTQERDAQVAQGRNQQIEESTAQLTRLLDKPDFEDPKWASAVRTEQQKLEKIVGKTDAAALRSRERIAAAYLAEAKAQRSQKRLANADALLKDAQAYAPALAGLVDERTSLERDEAQQKAQEKSAEQQADISRLKQSVRAKAGAKDAGGAEEVFAQLTALLPASDPYLKTEGPQVIADAYVALASEAAKNNRVDDAQQLVAKALKRVPDSKPALALRDQLRQQSAPPPRETTATTAAPVPAPPASTAPAPAIVPAPSVVSTPSPAVASADPCARTDLIGNGKIDRASCRDPLGDKVFGPTMVVIPAGGPLTKPLAIGKFEITVRDYNAYCDLSKECTDVAASDDTIPITEITIQDAEKFANWLSRQTKIKYRLPTSAEWEWAAKAEGQMPENADFNCLVGSPSNPSKGARLRGAKTGLPNGWGLYNSVGNAREWAIEGTSVHALGGAHTDRMNTCQPDLDVSHNGDADAVTGFRLVREIRG